MLLGDICQILHIEQIIINFCSGLQLVDQLVQFITISPRRKLGCLSPIHADESFASEFERPCLICFSAWHVHPPDLKLGENIEILNIGRVQRFFDLPTLSIGVSHPQLRLKPVAGFHHLVMVEDRYHAVEYLVRIAAEFNVTG